MNEQVLFQEVQGASTKKPLRDLVHLATLSFLVSLLIQWARHRLEEPLSTALFLGAVLGAVISIFLTTRLVTQVRKDGIYVKYTPFQPAFRIFAWEQIREIYLRSYDPLPEYGGRGLKMGPAGVSMTAGGNLGLQLVLKDETRVLIGTRDGEALLAAIRRLQQI